MEAIMSASRLYTELGLVILAGSWGCAASVEPEHEQVESQSEALNFGPDFKVGVVAVDYVNGKAMKSTEAWSRPLSAGTASSGVTLFKEGYLNPDGPRVGLAYVAPGTLPTMATDFRLSLTMWDTNNAGTLEGTSATAKTSWASEGSNWSSAEKARWLDGARPDRFQIAIETRPWPTSVPQTLVDFRIGLHACNWGFCTSMGEDEWTNWIYSLATDGTPSWTHTLGLRPPPDIDINLVDVWFEVDTKFQ
jgi:hypothetical protein